MSTWPHIIHHTESCASLGSHGLGCFHKLSKGKMVGWKGSSEATDGGLFLQLQGPHDKWLSGSGLSEAQDSRVIAEPVGSSSLLRWRRPCCPRRSKKACPNSDCGNCKHDFYASSPHSSGVRGTSSPAVLCLPLQPTGIGTQYVHVKLHSQECFLHGGWMGLGRGVRRNLPSAGMCFGLIAAIPSQVGRQAPELWVWWHFCSSKAGTFL